MHKLDLDLCCFLSLSNCIKDILKPVFQAYSINSCGYFHIYENGEMLHLSSDRRFDDQVIDTHRSQDQSISIIEYISSLESTGKYITELEPKLLQQRNDIINSHMQKFQYDHELLCLDMIETERGKAYRVISFSAAKNQEYLNQLIFKPKIIDRINQKLTIDLIPHIHNLELLKPNENQRQVAEYLWTRLLKNSTQNCHVKLCQKMNIHLPKYKQLQQAYLTPREKQVIYWYIRGKSASETAALLSISQGTVRTHFERMKIKFDCQYKPQLLLKLIDAGLIKDIDWQSIYQ